MVHDPPLVKGWLAETPAVFAVSYHYPCGMLLTSTIAILAVEIRPVNRESRIGQQSFVEKPGAIGYHTLYGNSLSHPDAPGPGLAPCELQVRCRLSASGAPPPPPPPRPPPLS